MERRACGSPEATYGAAPHTNSRSPSWHEEMQSGRRRARLPEEGARA